MRVLVDNDGLTNQVMRLRRYHVIRYLTLMHLVRCAGFGALLFDGSRDPPECWLLAALRIEDWRR
jgi:hypothetical protein